MMKKLTYLTFIISFLIGLQVKSQTVKYVKPGAMGDGSSWANAGDLQEMINNANEKDQVWVAKGIYKPIRRPDNIEEFAPSNDRFNSFLLKYGISVYGGFAGDETSLDDRDIATNETILSGEIGDLNTKEDNCYHVVTIVGEMGDKTYFDGFTVEDGYTEAAAGTSNSIYVNGYNIPSTRSPGIIAYYVNNIILQNLIVRNNTNAASDQNAGALYMFYASGTIRNVEFIGNTNLGGAGGAMYTYGVSNLPTYINFYNVKFKGNRTNTYGGALYGGQHSHLKFYDCLFEGNSTVKNSGGAFYLGSNTSTFEFNNTDFIDNSSQTNGGAIYAPNSGRLSINGGVFRNNKTIGAYSGGAICGAASGLIMNIKGAIFDGNSTSDAGGGAIYFTSGTYTVEDCSFKNNTASSVGGGIYCTTNAIAPTKIINCDFENNTAGTNGGAIYLTGGNTSAQIISCRIINNVSGTSGGAMAINSSGALTVINSLIYGNETKTTGSAGGGGAVYLYTGTMITIINSTIAYNKATSSGRMGGAIYLAGTSSVSMFNTLSYGNRGATNLAPATTPNHEFYGASGSVITLKNTITEFYGTNGVDGNVVGQDPLFLSTTLGDPNFMEVASGSPIIDKGILANVSVSLELDALGKGRIYNGLIDIGAVEYMGAAQLVPTVFAINENSAQGTIVGTASITLPGTITNWQIIEGNDLGAFTINASNGEITVLDPIPLNYEVIKQFKIRVLLTNGMDSQIATVIINLNNLVEDPEKPMVDGIVFGDIVTTYRPTIRGIAEANSIVIIYIDGVEYPERVLADENGAWSFRFPTELNPGYRTFKVKALVGTSESGFSLSTTVNLKLFGGGTAGLKPTNILTPNGDGKNDVWTIGNLSLMYPKHEIIIYDKVGKVVFKWNSDIDGPYDADNLSGRAWDGTFQGNVLPAGTYYYNINIGNSLDRIKGTITIIRGR